MFCFFLGVLITLAGIGALLWLAWRRLIRYLRANPDAVKALADNLSVLVGKAPETPAGADDGLDLTNHQVNTGSNRP